MFEQIQISDVDVRIGQDRIRLDQPQPEKQLVILRFSEDLFRRVTELEQENEILKLRIEALERRTLMSYISEAWSDLKYRIRRKFSWLS